MSLLSRPCRFRSSYFLCFLCRKADQEQIAQLHGGLLMADSKLGHGVNMVAVIPLRDGMPPRRLETPPPQWGDNGLDSVLVGLSDVLPAQSFAPDTLG